MKTTSLLLIGLLLVSLASASYAQRPSRPSSILPPPPPENTGTTTSPR